MGKQNTNKCIAVPKNIIFTEYFLWLIQSISRNVSLCVCCLSSPDISEGAMTTG